MRFSQIVMVAAAGTLVAGCAETYPPLYSRLPKVEKSEATLDQILRSAEAARTVYAQSYRSTAKADDTFNIFLVGAASVAAALVFGDGKHLAKRLGYGALGVGAVTAARGVASPAGMTSLYVSGHQAIGCVIAEGALFTGSPTAASRHADLLSMTGNMEVLVETARDLYASSTVSAASNAQVRAAFQTASLNLNDAVLAGDAALKGGRTELNAYGGAEQVFEGNLDAIQTKVATKGREGRAVEFDKLAGSLAAAASAAGANGAPLVAGNAPGSEGLLANNKGLGSREKDGWDELRKALAAIKAANSDETTIERMNRMANELKSRTATLIGKTPAYAKALERVAACPSRVGMSAG